jgi:hypothetical protein
MRRYRELYRAEQMPTFQNRMFHNPEDAIRCTKGDVVLVQDLQTGLIYNQAFDPELMRYDADYQNEQAVSSVFQAHLQEISDIIHRHFRHLELIEVGCGKGYFLEQLRSRGFQITGLDPTYEGENPHIQRKYFSPDIGLRAEGIILRHVLEHVQLPADFLAHILDANGGSGKIYIEVPCFDWICRHRAWFDIFYEHVNYFRISDFERMFGNILESGHTFGGQYLYVIADLASLREPLADAIVPIKFPDDFLRTVKRYAAMLHGNLPENNQATHSAIWGGASKGVIFALFMQRAGAGIDHVIDINPAKQGMYLAATGLRVSAPDEVMAYLQPGSDIFVMNGNYLTEIQLMTHNRFNYHMVDHEII